MALIGIAAMLGSAFFALIFLVGYGYGTTPLLGALFLVLALAMLVGTVALIRGSAWAAVLIALFTASLMAYLLLVQGTIEQQLGLAVATVLTIAVAIGLIRDTARRSELTGEDDAPTRGPTTGTSA